MDDILLEDIDDEEVKDKKNIKNDMKNKKNKKKKVKKLNIYLFIISIILILMIFLTTYLIIKYDILPFKYLVIFIIVVVVIPFVLIFLTLKKKKKKGNKLKVFLSIIEIIYILILSFGFYYLNKTFNFLDDFTSNNKYQFKNFYVVALNKSDYKEIKDLDTERIGFVNNLNSSIDSANKKLSEVIKVDLVEYDDYTVLINSLDKKEIEGFVIGDSYFDSLVEEDEELKEKLKVIYKFSLKEKLESFKKEVNLQKDTFNIYISGIDSYGDVNSLTRSDVNIIVSVNPKTHQILMINIPRDYYVALHGTGKKDKLTHAGIYGLDMSVKTLEDLLDIEINYYFKVNYGALEKLVDALGGVDVYSKYNFTTVGTDKSYYFKKGLNRVNGEKALYFVRTREAFNDGDRVRGENQQAMIQAIIKKACSKDILFKYSNILDSLKGTFTTNFSTDEITDVINMQLDKMPSWNITSISLNGSDASEYTYSYPNQKLYVMKPNEETVNNAKETLEKVKKGDVLDSSYNYTSSTVNEVNIITPKKEEPKKETKTETDTKSETSEKTDISENTDVSEKNKNTVQNDKKTVEEETKYNND